MPDGSLRRELVRGRVISTELAGFAEGEMSAYIGVQLWAHVRRQRSGVVVAGGTGFILARNPDTVRSPDVAFVRQSRIAGIAVPQFYFPGAPDLAVEVVAPSDHPNDIQAKVHDWLSHGTTVVWVAAPLSRTVTVHHSPGDVRELGMADSLELPELLPDFRLGVAEIFPTA
jgi:Uma2 family endonuclease